MPWKDNSVLNQRLLFIAAYLKEEMSVTDLCKQFGISRTIGYKYIHRYRLNGPAGLEDMPKAPHTHPNAIDPQTQSLIIELKTKHPHMGPSKLRDMLMRDFPGRHWPAASTIGDLLKSNGLVKTRRIRRSVNPTFSSDLFNPDGPNSLWTADYKGNFRLGDGKMCYPLTICDAHSRMLLRCQALPNTSFALAKPVWVAAFREYGMPLVIRTDNGSPFASSGLAGLSRLSAWWIRLGIIPERIQPGKPQQNGRHERMHKTLKEYIGPKAQANMKAEQKVLEDFMHEYNYIRPHQSLAKQTPASLYSCSSKEYPLILPEIYYPDGVAVRVVRSNGEIRWHGDLIFVSEALVGEPVGLDHLDERHFILYYSNIPLAILDGYEKRWLDPKKAAPTLLHLRKELYQTI